MENGTNPQTRLYYTHLLPAEVFDYYKNMFQKTKLGNLGKSMLGMTNLLKKLKYVVKM